MTETVETQAIQVNPDYGPQNPFWPKTGEAAEGTTPGAQNQMVITNVGFGADPADVTVTVTTFPAASAWTINWGDGGANVPIAAGTLTATHHYADKTAGKKYTITATSGTDTDTKNVQY